MKKMLVLALFFLVVFIAAAFAADQKKTQFEASGEVVSADPLYGRVTIKHGAIKGLSGDAETEFFVTSPELLKGIAKRDLVDFVILEEKGETRIEKLTKTGEAPPQDDRSELGKAMQGALVSTGEAAKTVTSPVMPVHEVVSGAVGATTDTTGAVLDEAEIPEVKRKF